MGLIDAAERVVVQEDAITGKGDDVIGGQLDRNMMQGKGRTGTETVGQVAVPIMVGAGQELGVVSLLGLAGMIDG